VHLFEQWIVAFGYNHSIAIKSKNKTGNKFLF